MHRYLCFLIHFFLILIFVKLEAQTDSSVMFLKDRLSQARPGDFIVVCANRTNTLMHIYGTQGNILTVEEITIPSKRMRTQNLNWKDWVEKGAPNHTSWVMYDVDMQTGQMLHYYSFSKQGWFDIPEADNFLFKLLNLQFVQVSPQERKKVGLPPVSGPDFRAYWQPRMVFNGQVIPGVIFDAWKTKWPKDGSDLSGRIIEAYLPHDSQSYPSYFPYWLQISGALGKAKIRIIDSGTDLNSPKPSLNQLRNR